MKAKKTVWIPAVCAAVVAVLLVAYYYYMFSSHGRGGFRPPENGGGNFPAKEMRGPRDGDGPGGIGGFFTTLGTVAVFLGAASFSWFWFKKKLRSPSVVVRKVGKLLYTVHKLLGWVTLIIIAVHGTYFLITKLNDDKIYTGLAGFIILLTLAAYGFFIKKIRNKWMRLVHRSLGVLWAPILLIHAGGSAIIAIIACIAIWGLVWIFERTGKPAEIRTAIISANGNEKSDTVKNPSKPASAIVPAIPRNDASDI